MKLEHFFNKASYLSKQNKKQIFISILASALLICYYLFVAIPYGGSLGIGGADCSETASDQIKYALIIIPFTILYFMLIQNVIKNLKFLRIFIYPTILLLIFFCLFMCASIGGYVYIMLFLYASYYTLPATFVIIGLYSIIKDIKTYKNTTVPEDYSIYQNISISLSKWESKFSKLFGFIKNICLKIWNYFTEDIKKS